MCRTRKCLATDRNRISFIPHFNRFRIHLMFLKNPEWMDRHAQGHDSRRGNSDMAGVWSVKVTVQCRSPLHHEIQTTFWNRSVSCWIPSMRYIRLGWVDVPTICVLGDQSVGKSSVIETISGINVPRALDTYTLLRVPRRLRGPSVDNSFLYIDRLRTVGCRDPANDGNA